MRKIVEKEKVKDLLYNIRNEFENELDYDYETESGKELTDSDFEIMTEYLDRFLDKVNLCLDDELEDINTTPLEQAILNEIDMILECYEDYENVELSENTKIDIAWNIINYEDNLWEELNNTICDYISKELVKNYMNAKKESEK